MHCENIALHFHSIALYNVSLPLHFINNIWNPQTINNCPFVFLIFDVLE